MKKSDTMADMESKTPQSAQASQNFYILSIKWTNGDLCCWWGPKNCGYTTTLEDAGKYSAEEIADHPRYYNDGESTRAIPCGVVEARAKRTVRADLGALIAAAESAGSPVPTPPVRTADSDTRGESTNR